ncbi:MAG: hypothetical protein WCS94_24420 [Verrucomicrobiota bacterium]
MIIKHACEYCHQPLEFDAEAVGTWIACPACGIQIRLPLHGLKIPKTIPRDPRLKSETPRQVLIRTIFNPSPKTIENRLEEIASLFWWVSFIAACLSIIGLLGTFADEKPVWVLFPISLAFLAQGWIMRAIFQAAAEAIRLLRQSANRP